MALATPAPPPAANPYAYARPINTPFAPKHKAFTTSPPLRIPPSNSTSIRSLTASTINVKLVESDKSPSVTETSTETETTTEENDTYDF